MKICCIMKVCDELVPRTYVPVLMRQQGNMGSSTNSWNDGVYTHHKIQ